MINVLAIDDEPLALKVLESHLQKIPFIEKIVTTTKVLDAYTLVDKEQIQLIYLDIQMPDLTGLQFMKLLQGKAKVIITTAHQQYALDGYEYNVIDYLLKPISFERLFIATKKALEQLQMQNTSVQNTIPSLSTATTPQLQPFIFVKTAYRLQRVFFDDIYYIEGGKDYATIYTAGEKVLSLTSLSKIMEYLPSDKFIRVHKSYIVALEKISSIEKQRIIINNEVIPIGDTFKDAFQKHIREI
ncbi:LytTR family two component transcriptional regulator [Chitinophaga skermanii]|uniref:LytTR family two component transcriptional regulator n=1 Tax=Chitinophaga skermanii TaxID=331697 RepID=A0A327R5B0_9BACT|nr:LytTR family DNA-binding domain-containing protein [Chitinophaga skermanii]RAJ11152.1 LytTR family two component transcriptional regulator [Chitinophaga skermanii]